MLYHIRNLSQFHKVPNWKQNWISKNITWHACFISWYNKNKLKPIRDKLRVQWAKSAAHQLATAFTTCITTINIFIIGQQPLLDRACSKTVCRKALLSFQAICLQDFVIFRQIFIGKRTKHNLLDRQNSEIY